MIRSVSTMDYSKVVWRKSKRSYDWKELKCVELAPLYGRIVCRNSNDPGGPVVFFTKEEMKVFFQGVKDGEFDDLVE